MPAVKDFAERFNAIMNRGSTPLDTVMGLTSSDLPVVSFYDYFSQKESKKNDASIISEKSIPCSDEKKKKKRTGRTNPTVDRALELLNSGVTAEKVLQETGLSRGDLIKYLHERKINWRKYDFPVVVDNRVHPKRDLVLSMIQEGKSIFEVVEELKDPTLKKDTIIKWCKRKGIVPISSKPAYLKSISKNAKKKRSKPVLKKSKEAEIKTVLSTTPVDSYKNMLHSLHKELSKMTMVDFMSLSAKERNIAMSILEVLTK